MTKENKAKASSAVEAIRDLNGSGTNLWQGLLKGSLHVVTTILLGIAIVI